jgi:hypothetical protein
MIARTPKRHVVLVLAIVGTAMAAILCKAGQLPDKTDWGNLGQLAQGDQIRVVLNDGRSFRARFETFTEEAVVVSVATGREALARKDVLRVSTQGPAHVKRNIVMGMAVGAAAGAAAVALTCRHTECKGPVVGIGALFGIPVGALVGGVIPTDRWHDVYRAPVRERQGNANRPTTLGQ